jgi:hypothetical protein
MTDDLRQVPSALGLFMFIESRVGAQTSQFLPSDRLRKHVVFHVYDDSAR